MPGLGESRFGTEWRMGIEARLTRLETQDEKIDRLIRHIEDPESGMIVKLDRLNQSAIQVGREEERRANMRISVIAAVVGSVFLSIFGLIISVITYLTGHPQPPK
jgi:hypothetical protein